MRIQIKEEIFKLCKNINNISLKINSIIKEKKFIKKSKFTYEL